jgi:hypothetical protein
MTDQPISITVDERDHPAIARPARTATDPRALTATDRRTEAD